MQRLSTLSQPRRLRLPVNSDAWYPIVITGVALVLSFWRLGYEPLWFDEAWSIELSKRPVADTLAEYLRTNREGPPLYYTLLHFWMALFGDSEVAARALSALAGSAAVFFHFLFLRQFCSHGTTVLASLLMATSPSLLHFAQEARNYSLTLMLFSLSLYLFLRFVADPAPRKAVVLSLINAIALLNHVFSVEVIFAQAVVILWLFRDDRTLLKRWIIGNVLLAGILVPYLFLIPRAAVVANWVPSPTLNSFLNVLGIATGSGYFDNPSTARLYGIDLGSPDRVAMFILFLGLWVCGGLVALKNLRTRDLQLKAGTSLELLTPIVVTCLPLAIGYTVGGQIFIPRYLIMAIPHFLFLVALGVSWLFPSTVALTVVAIVTVALNVEKSGLELKLATKDDWRAAAALVSSQLSFGDTVIVSDGRGIVPFEYYYAGSEKPVPIPGDFGFAESPREVELHLRSITVPGGRLWLVMPWGGAVVDRRIGLWVYLESREKSYPLLQQRWIRGSWGGIRVHLYGVPPSDPTR